ncbi:gastrula zinc finger protein XlCGF7.1-like isoform X2 [Archocentrus centrarchus]|uniref:gastrula zinc finger protein XlCGF7.1-like isoform X2 n=1 Tax=Archocentrus centrarchus TaxID=63155 RepID=UPI0011EA031F|nr:gastrula zinc finger protein XlCGF7.1-like isoform X2 [Archocentrus centrarchus]
MEPRREGLPPGVRKVIVGEEEAQEWRFSMDREDPGIKEEQEEVDINQFTFSPVSVKSEGDEEKSGFSQLHHSQTEEIGDSVGLSEPDPDMQPDEKTLDSSGTDVSDADCEQSSEPAQPQTSYDDVEKPFNCFVCGRKFGHRRNLNRHLRTHTGEKPFSCSQCGKRFVDSGNLHRHVGIHTEKKPFSCSECGRGFKDKTTLMNHLRTHTGEKPFGCPFCGKTFTHSGSLKQHLSIHTGEKPYSCPECTKTFSRKTNLKTHMKIHTGEKSFSCNFCHKTFTRKHHMQDHQRVCRAANRRPSRNQILMPRPLSTGLVVLVYPTSLPKSSSE